MVQTADEYFRSIIMLIGLSYHYLILWQQLNSCWDLIEWPHNAHIIKHLVVSVDWSAEVQISYNRFRPQSFQWCGL